MGLVVWEGFMSENEEPWRYYQEPQVRQFLITRAKEGYAFPLNPVWPVRDKGWYEVLQALRGNPLTTQPLSCWYPAKYGVLEIIDRLHSTFPEGFNPLQPQGFQARSCASRREDAELIMHGAKRKANKEPVRKKVFRELCAAASRHSLSSLSSSKRNSGVAKDDDPAKADNAPP